MNATQIVEKLSGLGIEITETAAKTLIDNEFETVEQILAHPMSLADYSAMGLKGRSAAALVAYFSKQSQPVTTTTAVTQPADLDSLLADRKTARFDWETIKTYSQEIVSRLIADFFSDTNSTSSAGWRFMDAVAQRTRGPVIAKVKGKVNQEATEKLVWKLIQGNANIKGDIFMVSPSEKYVVVSLSEVNTRMVKRDVMDTNGGVLAEGSGISTTGVILYDPEGNFVLPKEVQEFLALAYAKGEVTPEKMASLARAWRRNEASVTVEELQYDFPKTWEEVSVRGVDKYPALEVKEGEQRLPFAQTGNFVDQGQAGDVSQTAQLDFLISEVRDGSTINFLGNVWTITKQKAGNSYLLKMTSNVKQEIQLSTPVTTEMVDRVLRRTPLPVTSEGFVRQLAEAINAAHTSITQLPSSTDVRNFIVGDSTVRGAYNNSELMDLCFHMRINYENLPGNNFSDKARELITHCERRGRFGELVNIIKQQRPGAPW